MSTRLQISVEGGTSDRTSIELVPGTPVEPFSVGSQASWVVSGAGVMSTHAYLYFDGTTLFVAAAPGTQVRAADADVTADWKPLTPPCAIELGAVRLSVRTRVLPQPNQPEPRPERPAPPSVPPASDGATVVQPLEEFLAQHKPNEADAARRDLGPPLPAAGRPPEPGFGAGYGAPAAPGAAPWTPGAYGAPPAAMGGGPPPMPGSPMGGPPMPGAYGNEQPYGGQPGYPPPPGGFGMPGMQPPGMQAPGMATPAQQYGQVMPGPGQQAPGGATKKDPIADVKRAWAAASLPRRIMWVLGPFILIGAFYTALKPKAKPRRPSTKATASASASPSGSSAIAPKPTQAPPKTSASALPPPDEQNPARNPADPATEQASGKPEEPVAEEAADAAPPEPPPKGQLTKQRQAVDAVALGDYEKAVTLYEELAAENPKNQDYKTAIEVLKKKKAGAAKKK